jgi:acyl-CoA synthetase (AMP-forming)/AMP-acid ligase II
VPLSVVVRSEVFKVKGATVYPSEVEAALRATPGVSSAFVANVASVDGNDEVGALVVSSGDTDTIRAAIRQRLSAFKVPTRWLVVTDPAIAPMSATGKVDKARLQQMLSTEGSPAEPTLTQETTS